jgi:predicted enzyme related to lactoylglutathione lyase
MLDFVHPNMEARQMTPKPDKSRLPAWLLACSLVFGGIAAHVQAADAQPPVFVWHDLVTPDTASAKKFYSEVFGWTSRTGPDGSIVMDAQRRPVAAIYDSRATADRPAARAQWVSAISSQDEKALESEIKALGGSVLIPAKYLKGKGMQAVYRDPQGAVFSVLKPDKPISAKDPVKDGEFFWQDLFVKDPKAASEFYATLFGFEAHLEDIEGLSRVVLSSADYSQAGIDKLPEGVQRAGWLPYVLVDDVPGTISKAIANGGKSLVAPTGSLLSGKMAVIADPSGAVIGLIDWAEDTQGGQP